MHQNFIDLLKIERLISTHLFERFVPSSSELKFGANYKGGQRWEVDVVGAVEKIQYKDATPEKTVNVGVVLKLILD